MNYNPLCIHQIHLCWNKPSDYLCTHGTTIKLFLVAKDCDGHVRISSLARGIGLDKVGALLDSV
jgi:hypothetical protein